MFSRSRVFALAFVVFLAVSGGVSGVPAVDSIPRSPATGTAFTDVTSADRTAIRTGSDIRAQTSSTANASNGSSATNTTRTATGSPTRSPTTNTGDGRASDSGPHPPDPPRDVVGWEGGYWYNESVNVDQSDGLSKAELRKWVSLAEAHVEYITGQEFTRPVHVRIATRENAPVGSLVRSTRARYADKRYVEWEHQVYEAQFASGEDSPRPSPNNITSETLLDGVIGLYDPSTKTMIVLRNDGGPAVADNSTLHHELTHALQDQHGEIRKRTDDTQDGQNAKDGITEGQATYVEHRYREECRPSGVFHCVDTPRQDYYPPARAYGGVPPSETWPQPYTDGASLVRDLRASGGSAAVQAALHHPPTSTEQTIHPDRYPKEQPRPLDVRDETRNGWETFLAGRNTSNRSTVPLGQHGTTRVGELGLYGMFANQTLSEGASIADISSYSNPDNGRYDVYNYSSPATAGWVNDRLIPYRKPTENRTEYGYVWVTAWNTPRDARQFRAAYLRMLRAHDARRLDDGTFVVPYGPFADAFRVQRIGDRVVIVNGPKPSDLNDIHPRSNSATRFSPVGQGQRPRASWASATRERATM